MLHMSSTHQMQQIHPSDLSLICPHVGVMGVRVRCSLPQTRLEQAKKTQPVNGNGQFSKKYGSRPRPNPHIFEKPFSRAFRIYPTYPYLRNTQWAQMREQWHRPLKTHRVGAFPNNAERYVYLYVCMYVLWHGVSLIPWLPQKPTPLRFPVWLGIRKPMIPYPLLWEGAVRTFGSHLGRIPNCSQVPDTPPLPEPLPPRTPPSQDPPSGR